MLTVFANRLLLTPLDDLPFAQPRADLLAVISAGTLVLYGLTRVEVTDRTRVSVDMGGVEVRSGFEGGGRVVSFADWAARTIFAGAPAFKSFALVVGGEELCRVGRFRDEESTAAAPAGGIAAGAAESGKRAYLADLKVVPVRETEFAFLPEMCQVRTVFGTVVVPGDVWLSSANYFQTCSSALCTCGSRSSYSL